ncbi:MAG TPA: hypothetical protein VF345_14070 [Chthoniobacterales bacterium]
MIHLRLVRAGAVLALGVLLVGAVIALGQKSSTSPERAPLSENARVVPSIRVPSHIHLNATESQRSSGIQVPRSPNAVIVACDVTIAPGISPGGGYLPLSAFGIPPVAGVADDNIIDETVPAFTFAGETYTKIGFSSNGYAIIGGVTDPSDNSLVNQNFPNATKPNNVLAPFWTDLNPSVAGALRIGTLTDGTDTWIVLDWAAVREFSTANSNSFEIWIGVNGDGHPGEDITFAYGTIQGSGNGGFLTVGAENKRGDHGQNFYFNGAGTLPSSGTQLRVTTTSCATTQAVNLSTRMRVQTGDGVGIGGFIVTGSTPKHVLLRAIGPSLSQFGVPNVLADPVLELHGPGAFVTVTNDNWRDTQQAAIQATGIPPSNDLESAIDATLDPGAYTAIVRGKNNTSGVALIEVYDLNQSAASKLANLSTRAFVSTGDNIVIGGFLLSNNSGTDRVVVRGLGPSLSAAGVPNVVADPTLELRDANGTLLIANNDWHDNPAQAAIITAAGLAPGNNLESAIAATLPPGPYTGLLRGLNSGTGIGLVEVYDLGP